MGWDTLRKTSRIATEVFNYDSQLFFTYPEKKIHSNLPLNQNLYEHYV